MKIKCERCEAYLPYDNREYTACDVCGEKPTNAYIVRQLYLLAGKKPPIILSWEPKADELLYQHHHSSDIPEDSLIIVNEGQTAIYFANGVRNRINGGTIFVPRSGNIDIARIAHDIANSNDSVDAIRKDLNTKLLFVNHGRYSFEPVISIEWPNREWTVDFKVDMALGVISDDNAVTLLNNAIDFSDGAGILHQIQSKVESQIKDELSLIVSDVYQNESSNNQTGEHICNHLYRRLKDHRDYFMNSVNDRIERKYGITLIDIFFPRPGCTYIKSESVVQSDCKCSTEERTDSYAVKRFIEEILEKNKTALRGRIKILPIAAAGALCLTIALACEYGPDVMEKVKMLFPADTQQLTDHTSEFASAVLQTSAEHFTYEVNSSGGYTITGYKGPENAFIYIPEEIGGTPVSEIGEEAFVDASITGVHIPGTIKTVGVKAFWGCNQMKSVILEEGVEKIGFFAFGHCTALESLNIPASITNVNSIIPYCPSLTELMISEQLIDLKVENGLLILNDSIIVGVMGKPDSISIPTGIEQLDRAAFWNQDNLTNVIIPEGVKEIEGECFRACDNLESVILPASVELIEDNAFADCPKLKTIYGWNDAARDLANELGIQFVELKPTPTPAPKTSLGAEMYAKAQKLIKDIEYALNDEGGITITKYTGAGGEDIVIPDVIDGKYVTEIGIDAFKTSAITGVYIPGSVKTINRGSFWNCDQLTEAVLEEGVERIRLGAFGDCNHLKKLNIPASVKSIGSIIYYCPELADLIVAKESTWIKVEGNYLIANSKSIMGVKGLPQKIDIPKEIEILWECVFRDQDRLISIEIPEGVKEIQGECFRYSDNLETVTLPASIETIGDNAFADCPKLKMIYGMNDVACKQAEDLGIEYIDLTAPTPTPAPTTSLSVEMYAKAQKLIKDIEYEVNSEGGITITKYTGEGGEEIVIPDVIDGKYVTEIGKEAFRESEITGVYIPSTVKTIGTCAFNNSDQLLKAVLEEGIEEIQYGAFGHCDHLRKLNIPASVKSISSIIPYSPELMELTVAKENTWLRMEGNLLIGDGKRGTSIFGIKGLPETIVIPDGIEILWDAVFWDQDNLTSIEIPEGVKEIKSECFRYSSNLTSVALPFSIETIGKDAFADCPELKVIGGSNPVAEAYAESPDGAGKLKLRIINDDGSVTELHSESDGLEYLDRSALEAYRFERDFEYRVNADGTLMLTKYIGKGKSFVIVPGEIDGMKVTELDDTVFKSNKEITHVTLSSSIVRIGDNSFEHCQNLKELKILGKLEYCGKYALSNTGLQVIRGIAGTRAESLAKDYNAKFIGIK